jgi:cytoskeletal protein RodZ
MSVVTRPFAGLPRTHSNDRIDPNNFVCLSDADRVRDEERSVSAPVAHGAFERGSLSDDAWSGLEVGQTLGQLISAARKNRSLSREQVAEQTYIPSYYIRMIESDCYDAVPDQLYLLPFFERYANFLGLDAQRVVSRFIRDFEKAENEPVVAPPTSHAPARTAVNIPQKWRRLAEAAVIVGILLPFVGWEVGTMRAHHRQIEAPSVAAISSVAPPPVTTPNDIQTAPAVQSPVQTTDPATTTAPSSAAAQTAPPTITPTRKRRRGRSHVLNRHSRRSRRGIS